MINVQNKERERERRVWDKHLTRCAAHTFHYLTFIPVYVDWYFAPICGLRWTFEQQHNRQYRMEWSHCAFQLTISRRNLMMMSNRLPTTCTAEEKVVVSPAWHTTGITRFRNRSPQSTSAGLCDITSFSSFAALCSTRNRVIHEDKKVKLALFSICYCVNLQDTFDHLEDNGS